MSGGRERKWRASRRRRRTRAGYSPRASEPSRSPEVSPATMPIRIGDVGADTLADDPAFRAFYEGHELGDLAARPRLRVQLFQGLVQRVSGSVQYLIGAAQGLDGVIRKIPALEAADVDAVRLGAVAGADQERRHVLEDDRVHGRHAVGAEAAVLVHQGETAEHGVVADVDVAGEARAVGEDGLAADLAVVGDVAVGHEEIVPAHAGHAAAVHGPAVEAAKFADDVAVADLEARGLALVARVLGRVAERAELVDPVLPADAGRAVYDDVRADPGVRADLD